MNRNLGEGKAKTKPMICSYPRLLFATRALHLNNAMWTKNLHDVWKCGAPTPRSRTALRRYDERIEQAGVEIERLVLPTKFRAWVMDVARERGIEMTELDSEKLYSTIMKAWG